MPRRIGLIADTHGLVRPEVLRALAGAERILHAGDVGGPDVLAALSSVAPVTAVRGNNDKGAWASALRASERIEVDGVSIYLLHDLAELDIDPAPSGVRVVVTGHSHKPSIAERGGVLYVNPGSAGPRRFSLPIAAAWLIVGEGRVSAERVDLVR